MATEDKLTMTQINADGSQSILEITSKTLSPDEVNADPSLLELIIDAIFADGDEDQETYLLPNSAVELGSPLDASEMVAEPSWDSVLASNVSGAMASELDGAAFATSELGTMPTWSADAGQMTDTGGWSDASASSDLSDTSAESAADHTQAARDAQAAADEFIDRGDYRAAQEARVQAEESADLAGDQSMLSLYDSQDLGFAADKQEIADQHQQEQADLIAKGDYEGAREAAWQSGYATRDADASAGGADHSGQAGRDVQNLDWSVWNEKNADANVFHAEQAAADGDWDQAAMYADQAGWQQSAADQYADQANPDSLQWNHDPSATVESGGSYDATLNSIDAGFTPTTDCGSGSDFSTGSDDMSV